MTNRSIVFLTACTLAGLALLIGLGVWQLKRLAWKEGLIAEIETRAKGEPIALKDAIAVAREGRDPSYYRVRVDGRFDNAKELYLYSVADERVGWHVIAPLTVDGRDRGHGRSRLRPGRSARSCQACSRRDRRARSLSPASRARRKSKARSSPTTRSPPIAGSGATSPA